MQFLFGWFLLLFGSQEVGLPARDLVLQFEHRVGADSLVLFDKHYLTRQGEPFTVIRFRYYISHVRAVDADGRETLLSDRSYLVDEGIPGSKEIHLTGLTKPVRILRFQLGVDSALNVSGVQEGDLDPARGMFWTWNSGYIFGKLEGRSDSSHAPAHSLTWDIGGFRAAANALREVNLEVGPAAGQQRLVIRADVLKWFDGLHPVRIAEHPVCHQPGALAMEIADNYATMFSVRY